MIPMSRHSVDESSQRVIRQGKGWLIEMPPHILKHTLLSSLWSHNLIYRLNWKFIFKRRCCQYTRHSPRAHLFNRLHLQDIEKYDRKTKTIYLDFISIKNKFETTQSYVCCCILSRNTVFPANSCLSDADVGVPGVSLLDQPGASPQSVRQGREKETLRTWKC